MAASFTRGKCSVEEKRGEERRGEGGDVQKMAFGFWLLAVLLMAGAVVHHSLPVCIELLLTASVSKSTECVPEFSP